MNEKDLEIQDLRRETARLKAELGAYRGTGLMAENVTDLITAHGIAIGQLTEYRALGSIGHLRELVQAEKDGRLIAPPCKVGDTVYIPDYAKIAVPVRVQGISISVSGRTILHFGGYPVESAWGDEVGKTVFLTREEAEAALARNQAIGG